MEFQAFAFFISLINFILMFYLFYHIVVGPMEDAVILRQRKVQKRLDEIREIQATAQRMEAEVQAQFANLESEKQEMRAHTEREIERVRTNLLETADKDAAHLVAKTGRETEKGRQEALVALNRQLADKAMQKVESMLARALDAKAQESSAETVLERLVTRAS